MTRSLAIAATHPIQYYAPLYRQLAKTARLDLKIFYRVIPTPEEQGVQFNRSFKWDVDLLSGYDHSEGETGMEELLQGIQSRRWDAVMVHGWFDPFSRKIIQCALRSKVPVMVRGDSHLHTPRPAWKKALKYPLFRWLLPKFKVCLAVGTWSREYYLHYGVDSKRIIQSPHCVDNPWFREQARKWLPERDELRKKWGMGESDFVFLFVGRMNPMKRIPDFLQAYHKVRTRQGGARALLVGDGPDFESLSYQSKGLAGVTFTGFLNQSEIVQAYVASDLLVLPSSGEETWGLVVNEALCCGLPCIVSDQVGCGPDLIRSGINGDIFPCGQVNALADRMLEYYTRPRIAGEWQSQPGDVLEAHSCQAAAEGILNGLNRCVERN